MRVGQHIVIGEKLGLIFIAFAVMRILAEARCSFVFVLCGGMGTSAMKRPLVKVAKGSKQKSGEGSDKVFDLPRAAQDLLQRPIPPDPSGAKAVSDR